MQHQPLPIDKVKLVIFDWDNTLAETRTSLTFAVNQILKDYGMPDWEEVKKQRDTNLSFRDNFPRIFGSKAEEAYKKYAEVYLQNVKNLISSFKGTQEVLNWLKAHGIKIAIMTNKDRRLLEYELPLLFEPKLFDRIVCGHEAPRDKPYPDHAQYTIHGLLPEEVVSPETVWVVGDSPQDSICACGAGVLPIRIGHPIWGDEEKYAKNIIHYNSFEDFYADLNKK